MSNSPVQESTHDPAKPVNIIDEIRRVLDVEIEALGAVRNGVGPDYAKAVELIAASRGQVVVTGVGKSGIMARKIASTLRSTGTPAVFLHAAEALHGDLGVARPGDVVLAVGKSGESPELNETLRMLRKIGLPIIALTSSASSSMASLADVVLDLSVPREACPLNLAPTSSTTAAVAVGDAIAVALMKLNNISEDDFARRHPGGQLGRRLLLEVDDLMRRGEDNPVMPLDGTVREMIVALTRFRVGAVAVVDGRGVLAGLITDYDVRRALEALPDFFGSTLEAIMNPRPLTVPSGMKAVQVLELMRRRAKPTAVMPVVDAEQRAVGMVHLHDLIAAGL